MKEQVKPPLILLLICFVVSGLIVVVYKMTYVDTTGVLTDKLKAACVSAMGEGDFEMTTLTAEGVTSIVREKSGKGFGFEVTADGYAKGGLHLLVGVDADGKVMGVSVITLGETPGLGTKVNTPEFLGKYKGKSGELTVVKAAPAADTEIQAITGATYSSKGMTEGVNAALGAFAAVKGELSK